MNDEKKKAREWYDQIEKEAFELHELSLRKLNIGLWIRIVATAILFAAIPAGVLLVAPGAPLRLLFSLALTFLSAFFAPKAARSACVWSFARQNRIWWVEREFRLRLEETEDEAKEEREK